MPINPLQFREVPSTVTPLPALQPADLPELVARQFPQPAWGVLWLPHEVVIGRWAEGQFCSLTSTRLDAPDLLRLRMFDPHAELHIWRTPAGLQGRFRTDTAGAPTPLIEAHQVLVGTNYVTEKSGFTVIWEARGSELSLPLPHLQVDDKKRRLFIKTRNYIGTLAATGQATYTDCRFVAITDHEKELL